MPESRCGSIKLISCWVEVSSCSLLMARLPGLMDKISYQLGITMPPLIVTAWLGACGKIKRVLGSCGCSMRATGSKSLRVAPRPCNQITQASAGCRDSTVNAFLIMESSILKCFKSALWAVFLDVVSVKDLPIHGKVNA